MKDEEYEQLELLLGKLRKELKNRFCIIPDYMFDGVYIGLYGESILINQATGYNIKNAVEKLSKSTN